MSTTVALISGCRRSEHYAAFESTEMIRKWPTPGTLHLPGLFSLHVQHNPQKTMFSVPRDPSNILAGFREISYSVANNAVNHLILWLQRSILPVCSPPNGSPTVLAYTGPKDIRYPLLALACAKLEIALLLPSPSFAIAAQAHLVRTTSCTTFLYGGSELSANAYAVADSTPELKLNVIEAPELKVILSPELAPDFTWNKPLDEVRDQAWIIVHTSGTTGLPKPIRYTHYSMLGFQLGDIMPEVKSGEGLGESVVKGGRWYSPIPTLHMVGLSLSLSFPILFSGIAVFGPPEPTTTPDQIIQTLQYGKCQAIAAVPLHIDALARDPKGLEVLRKLDAVAFAGAPLSRPTAEKLTPHTRVIPLIGSTEAGKYNLRYANNEEDWEYHTFYPSNGFVLERISSPTTTAIPENGNKDEELFELVIKRDPGLDRWQQIFWVYPHLQEFRTGDLWVRHPSGRDAWKVVGRTDDLIIFAHGTKMNAAMVEGIFRQCEGVSGVVVGGKGRERPFLLVEWESASVADEEKMRILETWIDRVNKGCAEMTKFKKELVVFANMDKKLVRNVKGGVARKASEMIYAKEIEELYHRVSLPDGAQDMEEDCEGLSSCWAATPT